MDNDTISRQAAIDAADRADYTGLSVEDVKKVTDEVVKELKQLPSAQQEPKTAHWIPLDARFPWSDYYKCSECGFRIKLESVTDFGGQSVDYCPHCGKKIVEVNCKACGVTVTIKDGEVFINNGAH